VTREIVFRSRLGHSSDVSAVRGQARTLGTANGFSALAVAEFSTALSELAHNIIVHAGSGEIQLGLVRDGAGLGLIAIACDGGPGIANIEAAMLDGHSTGRGLGLGLPSARRLVDEFELQSAAGRGTTVTLIKWLRRPAAR
jgi:serine/threonine-protein kinase RsbT